MYANSELCLQKCLFQKYKKQCKANVRNHVIARNIRLNILLTASCGHRQALLRCHKLPQKKKHQNLIKSGRTAKNFPTSFPSLSCLLPANFQNKNTKIYYQHPYQLITGSLLLAKPKALISLHYKHQQFDRQQKFFISQQCFQSQYSIKNQGLMKNA